MRRVLAGLVAGVLVAVSLPPFGAWPLAFVGFALLYRVLDETRPLRRLAVGYAAGFAMYGIGLFWMSEFTIPGAVIVWTVEGLFVALAGFLTPPGRGRILAFPAALVVGEVLRGIWPVEGLPLAQVALGQMAGPLAPAARVGGALLILALVALSGAALGELTQARIPKAVLAIAAVVAVAGLATVAPNGGDSDRSVRAALVQGGGERGFRAVDTDPQDVFQRHLEATTAVRGPIDLLMWPEDVVDVDDTATVTAEGETLSRLAQDLDTTLIAGVVEGEGTDRFRNAAVAWAPDGRPVGRYEKVRRVPYGEYVPLRGLVDRVADLSVIPRDAIKGKGAGFLRTPAARVGVLISYEVFFNDRLRAAVNAGGQVVLVPTNAASFRGTQLPTQQLASARLRAIEAGRNLLQAGPTGYTAVIDNDGRVLRRTTLGRRQVLHADVPLRTGRTLFVRFGDVPMILLAGIGVVLGLVGSAVGAARGANRRD